MKILPVIDLLGGVVVRGVAGKRETYRPIESKICASAEPAEVAKVFCREGHSSAYVADLDAIMHGDLSVAAIQSIIDAGLEIWLDAGLRRADRIDWPDALQERIATVVLGTESVACDQLTPLLDVWQGRAVVSLDLMNGRMLGQWSSQSPLEVAQQAHQAGCRRFIALDLGQVGTKNGVSTLSLCQQLRQTYPDIELTSGGGVRHRDDLLALEAHGCDWALIASAIHEGLFR